MNFEIISTQFIKPSCPTPEHLKTHKISLLDQFMPPMHVPVVLIYTTDQSAKAITASDTTEQRLKLLKQSLSETLTHFYPLAGRIKDNLSVDCNDEGVYYIEAKASCTLFEISNQSNFLSYINKLLPGVPSWEDATDGRLAKIRVTCFECDAIVIGASVSHMIADGAALSFFLNSWAANTRGAFLSAFPKFDAPFPQNVACPKDANMMALSGPFLNKSTLAMRRFLFSAEAISKLKTQGSSLTMPNPTRVEAVSSLISKCATEAFKANSGLERPTLVAHSVNMRRKATPAFPESCMGNYVWIATALMSTKEKVVELPDFVIKLREALKSINSDLVKSFQGEGGPQRYVEALKEMAEKASSAAVTSGVNYVHFTSWCNFGLYDVDYGWGKPAWVTTCAASTDREAMFFNTVILMDTPSGNGIEAWMILSKDVMTIMQQDKEFLAFATLASNPLQLK